MIVVVVVTVVVVVEEIGNAKSCDVDEKEDIYILFHNFLK